jgi:hypothetical protein
MKRAEAIAALDRRTMAVKTTVLEIPRIWNLP